MTKDATTLPENDAKMLLLDALLSLHDLLEGEVLQPRHQIAEKSVVHWTRVVEGKETVQPRVMEFDGFADAFNSGVEHDQHNWIDDCVTRPDSAAYGVELSARLDGLRNAFDKYFHPSGYRSSSEHCDRMMVELMRLSRFLSVWCALGDRQAAGVPISAVRDDPAVRLKIVGAYNDPVTDPELPKRVREIESVWEPLLNEAIVAWEENALQIFDRALTRILELLDMSAQQRASQRSPSGFPLRQRGRPRIKVQVFSPEQRSSRTKSIFGLRFSQLVQRIEQTGDPAPTSWEALTIDVQCMTSMIESNRFMLVGSPGFWAESRRGQDVIRGRPETHPILLDPVGFFKKAVLFHNRTYTEAGGGPDIMFLQLRQLVRYCRFHPATFKRPVRACLDDAIRGWGENRWDAFTENMLTLAESLRPNAPE